MKEPKCEVGIIITSHFGVTEVESARQGGGECEGKGKWRKEKKDAEVMTVV